MPDTPATHSTGTEKEPLSKEQERAIFDKVRSKGGPRKEAQPAQEAKLSEAKPQEEPFVPEQMWREAEQLKERAKARAEKKAREQAEHRDDEEGGAGDGADLEGGASDTRAGDDTEDQDLEDPALERAKTALIRSGFKDKELASMSHKEILKRGLARARALEATDEAWNLAKAVKDGTYKPETQKQETTPDEADLPDLKEQLKPLADQLLLDESGAAALESAFKAILKPIVSKIEAKPEASGPDASQLQRNLDAARKELTGAYPQLVDPITFDQVVSQMDALAGSPKYKNLPSAEDAFQAIMRDSCMILGLEADEDAGGDRDGERKARRYSRSTPNERSVSRGKPAANPDREAFDYIRAHTGETRVSGARRAAGYS